MFKHKLAFIAVCLITAGLFGCNGNESDSQNIEADWIHTPDTTAKASPTPTATPTPSPSPSPSSTPIDVSELYTGPEDVAPYVQKFVEDGKIQGVDVLPDMKNPTLQIQISSLSSYGSGVIGLCETGGSLRRVTFDPTFWNSVSETQRELLAHHELGHCVLYRAHRSDVLSTGAYASIMYPIIMASSTYLNNYSYYQEELFTQAARIDPNAVTAHICTREELGL